MNASSAENSFKVGEQFLEEGNYHGAIAQFEKVYELTTDSALLSSAQRSLILAYEKYGDMEAAIRWCQQLEKEGHLPDQVWATQQLNRFNQLQNLSNVTGFVTDTPTESSPPPETPNPNPPLSSQKEMSWQNAPKAETWKPLKELSLNPLWRRVFLSLIAFFCLFDASINLFMEVTNTLLVDLPYFDPIQLFYRDPTWTLTIATIIIFLVSPWLVAACLKVFYQCRLFRLYKLTTGYPESSQFLQNYCRQQKIPIPELGILPSDAPLIFSYRKFPDQAKIIFSEGLLNRVSDEELKTLLAGEIAVSRYLPSLFFTGAIALLQIPYLLYFQISVWGERFYQWLPQRSPRFIPRWVWRDIPPFVRHSAAMTSNFFYLAYSLWKLPLNWLFQIQHSYRDYLSVSLTGNPNAKVRAIIKIAVGMKEEIETQKETSFVMESFNPLFPVSYRQGVHFGTLSQYFSLEKILNWEGSQELRHHLNWFHSHPLLSDRAWNLLKFAKAYKLPVELDIDPPTPPENDLGKRFQKLLRAYGAFPLFQRSVYMGITLGILFRLILWIIGMISSQLEIFALAWFADARTFLTACILLIFSLSIIIGTNHYFPNLKIANANNNPPLFQWLTTINHSQEVYSLRINGELFGRSGVSNWLGQDLILKTETGTIFLHTTSRLGIIGNLLPKFPRPNEFIQQPVIVSGWLRRGIIPWLDVERLTNNKRQSIRAGYPIWLTILAMGAAIWATQMVLKG